MNRGKLKNRIADLEGMLTACRAHVKVLETQLKGTSMMSGDIQYFLADDLEEEKDEKVD